MKGSWDSGAMVLEFAAGRDIVVCPDEDGLIYWAAEYDWRPDCYPVAVLLRTWQADTA